MFLHSLSSNSSYFSSNSSVLDTIEDKELEVLVSAPTRKDHLRCTVPDSPFLYSPLLYGLHGHLLVFHFQESFPDAVPWFCEMVHELEMSTRINSNIEKATALNEDELN